MSYNPFTLLLASFLFLSSCAMNHLGQAQRAFNAAAATENQQRFTPQPEVAVSPTLSYAEAAYHAGKALNRRSSLRKNGLLGNALALRALCLWKLNNYDAALEDSRAARYAFQELEQRTGLQMPRDEALMQALPSLIAMDQARAALFSFHQADAPYERARDFFQEQIYHPEDDKLAALEGALQELSGLQLLAGSVEELELYLVMSQLAGLKTWSQGIDFLRQSISRDESLNEAERQTAIAFLLKAKQQDFEPVKGRLLDELSRRVAGGTSSPQTRIRSILMVSLVILLLTSL